MTLTRRAFLQLLSAVPIAGMASAAPPIRVNAARLRR